MSRRTDAKLQALREARALNARAQRVADPLFGEGEFFDPRDLVQVKYEMLRRVLTEKRPVSEAATAFGFSRVAFYQAQAAFAEHGLPGLLAKRPGPRGAHKLSAAVVEYLVQQHAADQSLRAKDLAEMVLKKFGLTVHPRSIERALAKRRKKGR
jgi:transposase